MDGKKWTLLMHNQVLKMSIVIILGGMMVSCSETEVKEPITTSKELLDVLQSIEANTEKAKNERSRTPSDENPVEDYKFHRNDSLKSR